MSHFCGLVILTPEYAKEHDLEDSLAKYDENKDVPEYISDVVTDFEKVRFISYYAQKDGDFDEDAVLNEFADTIQGEKDVPTFEEFQKEWGASNRERYINRLAYDHKEDYAKFWIEKFPERFASFDEAYLAHGEDWNGSRWRINPENNLWSDYSTYNPDSKWDWYDECGRWSGAIKTKDGEYVNECILDEIDWTDFTPEDYEEEESTDFWGKKYHALKEGRKWHYTNSSVPFCLVVDGKWAERGQMLYWGFTHDEKNEVDWNVEVMKIINSLPKDSEVYNIDFHI